MFAKVAFPISSYKQFIYSIPTALQNNVSVGVRVKAPFGKRVATGIIVSMSDTVEYSGQLRAIQALVDDQPVFDEPLWQLALWMSEYYFTPIGQVVKTILPSKLNTKYTPPRQQIVAFKTYGNDKEKLATRAPNQLKVLEYLHRQDDAVSVGSLRAIVSNPHQVCKILVGKDLIEVDTVTHLPDTTGFTFAPIHKEINFTNEQKTANQKLISALTQNTFNSFMLHGVTGSGKTELYIELVRNALALEQTAIVLLPEISLTPQIAGRFRAVFGDRVALWHSKLSSSVRAWTWKQICAGEFYVVIGARSAIFAPLRNLGAVIVDEEQEHSYKQESPAPRYHTRDVALMRGKLHRAVVVMASATPSLESYYNQIKEKHTYLYLSERYGGIPYPQVHIVDMIKEQEETGKYQHIISGLLQHKIEDRLSKGEQVIILQNRRGFSPIVRCGDCGTVETCNDCAIPLTYHSFQRLLKCHFCGFETANVLTTCNNCNSINIKLLGIGTQRVEDIIKNTFQDASITRIDIDTSSRGDVLAKTLEDFAAGKIQILIGTQMIAKGLDFDKTTLVGIINGDTGLFLPDFRSGEKVFQLLYQAAGRSGRRTPGEVVIQTYNSADPVLKNAARLDLKTYYNIALSERQELLYPPFSWLIRIELEANKKDRIIAVAKQIRTKLTAPFKGLTILGPANCYRERLRGKYRMHIMLKSDKTRDRNGTKLHRYLKQQIDDGLLQKIPSAVHVNIDVNPVSVL